MAARGISVVDLLGLPPGSTALLPEDMRAELARLMVVDLQVNTSPDAFIHTGTVVPIGETLFRSTLGWPVRLPFINEGVPFQLVRRRQAVAGGADHEPVIDGFQIDLLLSRMAIEVPGLRPARLVPGAGVTAAHLVAPVEGDALFEKPVLIVGSATLRIVSAPGGGTPLLRFVAPPDPLDPDAPTGAVATLGFEPPHFFFGGSDFGMTVDRLLYDDSESFTPAEIMARGQGPDWRGIAIREATLYLPRNAPLLGDVSTGVRDVLLGSPLGLQGEVRVELGVTPVAPTALQLVQHDLPGTGDALEDRPLSVPAPTGDRMYAVTLHAHRGEATRVSAGSVYTATNPPPSPPPQGTPPADPRFRWRLPDGSEVIDRATGPFAVKPGDVLEVVGLEEDAAGLPVESPPIRIRFDPPVLREPPRIDVEIFGQTFVDVVSLSGDAADLLTAQFSAETSPVDTNAEWRWLFGEWRSVQPRTGSGFVIDRIGEPGRYPLVLSDARETDAQPRRRVEVDVVPGGAVLIGCRAGVFDANGPVPATRIAGTYRLQPFHDKADRLPADAPATLAGGTLTVPHASLAEVVIAPGAITAQPLTRHVQVLMAYNETEPTHFVADGSRDDSPAVPFTLKLLHDWRNRFRLRQADTAFIVVGRTCDIGDDTLEGELRNQTLSGDRAARGKQLLDDFAALTFSRGERFRWTELHNGNTPGFGEILESGASEIPAEMKASAVPASDTSAATDPWYDGWLFRIRNGGGFADRNSEAHNRPRYRRVDIHAVPFGAQNEPIPLPPLPPATKERRVLVPGPVDGTPLPPVVRGSTTPYRVRLVIRWASPSVVQLSDAIPTMAEITIAWPAAPQPVPGTSGSVTPVPAGPPPTAGPGIFTLVGGWTYEPRSGATQFSLAVNATGTPDGIAHLDGDNAAIDALAMAMALGPALLAGISTADPTSGAIRAGALVGAIAFAAAFGRDGRLVLNGFRVETRQQAISTLEGAGLRVLFDYTASIGFEFSALGISITAERPMSIRYRNVGVAIDSSKSDLDAVSIVYDNASFDIADPGQWTIDGPLGELIRVAATRSGSGSTWIELDLEFSLDLGVVRITGCTLRAIMADGGIDIEFRGFSAAVEVPGVIAGSGSVRLGSGGEIRAGVEADLIPLGAAAMASLAFDPPKNFFALEVGVMLPVGIPLAQSGLAIYGFIGRFVSNGRRDFTQVANASDPVGRELDWYALPGQDKYTAEAGQWALGLGISVGTMPDTGFTFNALGMLSVGFPDPDVVISIDVSLFKRPQLPAAQKPAAQPGLTILGMIAISPRAVVVAVKGAFEIPKVLRLEVPFGAYFPLPGNPDAPFVRIGADGHNGRFGEPVSLTLLPGTIDIKAWAYLMVESRRLHDLGGVADFDLDGFSLGFGAGWTMQWGARPIVLRASAKLLAGLGTRPLTIVAGLFLEGELRLFVVSLSVRGTVKALITEQAQRFTGEFCGKVDLWLTSYEGCVDVSFGSGADPGIPTPDHPLLQIDLTARDGSIVGRAYRQNEAQVPDRPGIAWPDTVPVLGFGLPVLNRLVGSAFAPSPAELPGPAWSGSTELKYAFRLARLVLRRRGGSGGGAALSGPMDSVWWWPTHRGGVYAPNSPPPSPQEGRQLALLSWHPAPWSRSLTNGGAGTPGDPAATLASVCDPAPATQRGCVQGDRAAAFGVGRQRLSGVAGTRFTALLTEYLPGAASLDEARAAAALAGWQILSGDVRPLPASLDVPFGPRELAAAWQMGRVVDGQALVSTLAARIEPSLPLVDAMLTLKVCRDGRRRKGPRCDQFRDLVPGQTLTNMTLMREIAGQPVQFNWSYPGAPALSALVDHFPRRGDGRAELWCGGKGLFVKLAKPVDRVEAQVAQASGTQMTMIAYDANNQQIGQTQGTSRAEQPHTLVIAAPGIIRLEIRGGTAPRSSGVNRKSGGSLLRLCLGEADPAGDLLRELLADQQDGRDAEDAPLVTAYAADGRVLPVNSKLVADPSAPGGNCRLLQVRVRGDKPVARFEVATFAGGPISLVSLCGQDWQSAAIAAADAAARAAITATLAAHADPASSERPDLLDADTENEIEVAMDWLGWRRGRDDPPDSQPPPPADGDPDWKPFDVQRFRFRTAALALPAANAPPLDVRLEATFDPRALARYLIGFDPDGRGAPHFLADPLAVDLRVDHVEPLLARYGRALQLKLRRTDPPPASLATAGGLGAALRPPDLDIMVAATLLPAHLLKTADRHFVDAAAAAPCLATPAVGGRRLAVAAALAPRAAYDLLMVAPPVDDLDADAVLIARSHFTTSRYAGPEAMLAAMGLALDGSTDPRLPLDALVRPMAVPAGDAQGDGQGDAAFESLLQALGLDPWPLPPAPRPVALWQETGGSFRLAGIMLESDEPMDRPGRMAISSVAVGGVALVRAVRNAAATRAIWLAATPFTPADPDVIAIGLDDGGTARLGRRALRRLPRLALQQGLS